MEGWITDWSKIDPEKTYLVAPINYSQIEGCYYLSGNVSMVKGWNVVRHRPKLYAAILLPKFIPEEHGFTNPPKQPG